MRKMEIGKIKMEERGRGREEGEVGDEERRGGQMDGGRYSARGKGSR